MNQMKIVRKNEPEECVDEFVSEAFSDYATANHVDLNYEDYWFVAEDDAGKIIGSITGWAYYNEVHIGDFIIDKNCRGQNIGTNLVTVVEDEYRRKGFAKISLTTFGFQTSEFYKKLGYSLEFVREDKDSKLFKFFYCKDL